ncbi:ATP synthase E chain [Aspergillus sp. HF37]|nr:ATP synthase E chain [Aspergillus sp. HF37]
MASTQGVNVLRYSALATGVLYGLYHQSSLNSQAKHTEAERQYAHKAQLIEQAKAEWRKRTAPQEPKPQTSGIITDFEDSRFDLEAYLKMKAGESK